VLFYDVLQQGHHWRNIPFIHRDVDDEENNFPVMNHVLRRCFFYDLFVQFAALLVVSFFASLLLRFQESTLLLLLLLFVFNAVIKRDFHIVPCFGINILFIFPISIVTRLLLNAWWIAKAFVCREGLACGKLLIERRFHRTKPNKSHKPFHALL